MNDPKKPPAARVHHQTVQTPSTGRSGGSQGTADDQINPEDLQNALVADNLLGSLPGEMTEENNRFRAAPQASAPGPKAEPKDQVVDR